MVQNKGFIDSLVEADRLNVGDDEGYASCCIPHVEEITGWRRLVRKIKQFMFDAQYVPFWLGVGVIGVFGGAFEWQKNVGQLHSLFALASIGVGAVFVAVGGMETWNAIIKLLKRTDT